VSAPISLRCQLTVDLPGDGLNNGNGFR
jgi:hypothetical protein